jgi:hypothetical protein
MYNRYKCLYSTSDILQVVSNLDGWFDLVGHKMMRSRWSGSGLMSLNEVWWFRDQKGHADFSPLPVTRSRRREVWTVVWASPGFTNVNRGLFPSASLLAISMVNWYFQLIKRGNQGYRRNAATGGYRSKLILIAPINWSHGVTRTPDTMRQSGATGLNKLTFTWLTLLNNALNQAINYLIPN